MVDQRMRLLLVAILIAAVSGCKRGADVPHAQEHRPVVAFVAASTVDAVKEIAAEFGKDKKAEIKINADDSSKLAMQIGEDAPAHVFLSANEKWADFVKDKGFAQETKVLLGNALVIVVPKGNPASQGAQGLDEPDGQAPRGRRTDGACRHLCQAILEEARPVERVGKRQESCLG